MNNQTYFDYLDRFKKVATSMFEWKDIPDSMDSRYLELSLYYMGKAALLYDKNYGHLNLKCNPNDKFNIYGIPTGLQCWSYEFHVDRKTYMGFDNIEEADREKYAVLVMNNAEMIPTAPTLELFAKRLAEVQRVCDINILQQRTPRIILTDKTQELTMRNMINQIDDNVLNIFGDKNIMTPDQIRSIDTEAPYLADKLSDYKKEIFNEALTFLGISNIDYKKERMITSETDSKNELINLNLQSYLATRKKACEQFNELFNPTDEISVRVRSDLHNTIKEMESIVTDYNDIPETEEGDEE
jgi:hypothetical protein